MTSALSVANQGFEVYLVEKDKDLGGMARRIHYTLEGVDVQAYLQRCYTQGLPAPLHSCIHQCHHHRGSGYVGNFVTKVKSRGMVKEIHHGITILATGAEEYKPREYLYGEDDRVSTQLELGEKIANREEKVIERPERGDDPMRGLQK